MNTSPTSISPANHRGRATSRRGPVRGRRRGTTLLELLVVVAIIAVLIAILFPAAAKLRQSSRDVVCQARLRKLAAACMTYRVEHNAYPQPTPPPPPPTGLLPSLFSLLGGLLEPQKVESKILNQLVPYGFPRVPAGAAAIDLPAELQSPDVESIDSGRGPFPLPSGQSSYYTGFNYVPGLFATSSKPVMPGTLKVLKPERLPGTSLIGARAVIWADDVHGTALGTSSAVWQFTHAKSGAASGPQPLTYKRAADCRGQHRAYADGSVDWERGDSLGLDGTTPAALDKAATYWAADTYWWF